MDLVVHGGTVVDGTGAPGVLADIGVRNGEIVAVGRMENAHSGRRLDASGLVVAPGFIDVHSHSDFTLLLDPRAQSQIFQGVTTEVIGNCGHGCAPLTDPALFIGNIYGYQFPYELDWKNMAEYLDRLESVRPAVNVVALVPNGNLRLAVLEDTTRPATTEETTKMGKLLEESLEAGAFGLSTGLEYPAESACSEHEIAQLCRIVARHGGIYATHARNKERFAVEAVEEAVRVANAVDVRLQVSHIIPRRGAPQDALEQIVEILESAATRGLDVGFDAHTRLHSITNLSNALPTWAMEGGSESLASRLQNPASRDKFRQYESIISSMGLGGWEYVSLFSSQHSTQHVGKNFAELARSGSDGFDAILDLLLTECAQPHDSMVIAQSYEESQLRFSFSHPLCGVGSDATALAIDGPLAEMTFLGAYTWAAWFFRRFVRDFRDFTIEEAVRKLTASPADRMGLPDRGRLAKGARADIIAFDRDRFRDRGTLEAPNQLADGMVHVIVNGGVAMESGRVPLGRYGEVLRRI